MLMAKEPRFVTDRKQGVRAGPGLDFFSQGPNSSNLPRPPTSFKFLSLPTEGRLPPSDLPS